MEAPVVNVLKCGVVASLVAYSTNNLYSSIDQEQPPKYDYSSDNKLRLFNASKNTLVCSSKYNERLRPLVDSGLVSDRVVAYESPRLNIGHGTALGSRLVAEVKDQYVIVRFREGFYDKDSEAAGFILKHEVGHVEHDDLFYRTVGQEVVALPVALLAASKFSTISTVAAYGFFRLAFAISYSNWCEVRADDFAMELSSKEELQGGLRHFTSMLERNRKAVDREDVPSWMKKFVSPEGEFYLDILHPSLSSRVEKVKKAIEGRA